MLGLKLNHVSIRGHWECHMKRQHFPYLDYILITVMICMRIIKLYGSNQITQMEYMDVITVRYTNVHKAI